MNATSKKPWMIFVWLGIATLVEAHSFGQETEAIEQVPQPIEQASKPIDRAPRASDEILPEVPKIQIIQAEQESEKIDRIRKVLTNPDTAPALTGDGLLDDVLGVIRENGSVLDGSFFDPGATLSTGEQTQPSEDEPSAMAIQLLTTAQMLSQFDQRHPEGESHKGLILEMRRRAGRLLRDAYGH